VCTRRMLLVLALGLTALGCGGGDRSNTPTGPSPVQTFRLTFLLDASFQGPHGGQPVSIAVVRSSDRAVVARSSGAVSVNQNPSFSFSAGAVMQRGVAYEVHYWIDSNLGGGALGTCDPRMIDHQWSVEFSNPTNDVTFTVSHNPALTEDVCSTFV